MDREAFIKMAIDNPYVKCIDLHGGHCNFKVLEQFMNGVQSLYKLYMIVHLIPFVLFKRKKLRQDFVREIKHFILGYIKSVLFAGMYSAISRRSICFFTQHLGYHSYVAGISAFPGGIALLWQSKGRQAEIGLYCLNKSIQTLYYQLKRRNYFQGINNGQALVFGLAFAIIAYYYQNDSNSIKGSYHSAFRKILGDI